MYVSTTVSEDYVFQGFGTTEDEASNAMVEEISEIQKVVLGHGITSVRY